MIEIVYTGLTVERETQTKGKEKMSAELKITINSNNSAFAEDPETETANILRDIAEKIEQGFTSFILFDSNGNNCGKVYSEFEKEF